MESKSKDWKPDLPAIVSFGKTQNYDIELSDCDNDKLSCGESEVPVQSPTKKTVHFGHSHKVHEETYEYPKCPSENCSCSTRSSSIGSMPDLTTSSPEEAQDKNEIIEKYKEVSVSEQQNNFTLAEHMNNSKNPVVELYKQAKIPAF